MDADEIERELTQKQQRKINVTKTCIKCRRNEGLYVCQIHNKTFCRACLIPGRETKEVLRCDKTDMHRDCIFQPLEQPIW